MLEDLKNSVDKLKTIKPTAEKFIDEVKSLTKNPFEKI